MRMCFATDAAFALCMPCSRNTTPAISGLARGEDREPAVISQVAVAARRGPAGERNDLRGAALAADILPGNRGAAGGAGPAVDHQPHALADCLELFGRHFN